MFQTGQALQTHLQDFLRLIVRQSVETISLQAVVQRQMFRTEGFDATYIVYASTREHFAHHRRIPRTCNQFCFGDRRRWCRLDDGDEFIDVGQGNRQTFQHMAALARFAQFEYGAACNDFTAMRQKAFQHLLQVQQLRLAIHQCHHVHAESVLQLGLLVEIIEHHFRHFAALQFDHYAHAGFI